MLEIIEQFTDIIEKVEVISYEAKSSSIKFIARLTFKNKSILIVRDYVFENDNRKYSYHWMNTDSELIVRWDNAPHYQNIKTFPFYKHELKVENVSESFETNIEDIFLFIRNKIATN